MPCQIPPFLFVVPYLVFIAAMIVAYVFARLCGIRGGAPYASASGTGSSGSSSSFDDDFSSDGGDSGGGGASGSW